MTRNRAKNPLENPRSRYPYSALARELGANVGDVWNVLNGRRNRVGKASRVAIVRGLESIGIIKPRRSRTRITVGHSGCAK